MNAAVVATAAGLAAVALVYMMRRYAWRRGILDVPGERSSHHQPVPRGGGIGIVIPFLVVYVLAVATGEGSMRAWPAVPATLAVAFVGWLDDQRSLGVLPRIAVHVGAGVLLAVLARAWAIPGPVASATSTVASAWWVLWTVSLVNVVNFMDGIDGMIGLQALVFGVFSATAMEWVAPEAGPAVALAAASFAFLLYNWPRASIFLGDVGSGSLGVVFLLVGLMTIRARGWSVLHAYLPLTPLFVDEVLTMARRLQQRERVWLPHRSHTYQTATRAGFGHGSISALYGVLAVLGGLVALGAPPSLGGVLPWAAAYVLVVGGALAVLHGLSRRRLPTRRDQEG